MRFRQSMLSAGVFIAILGVLVMVDDRVQERFRDLVSGGSISPYGNRISELGDALFTAVKFQSIENAPLLIFATVGAVLFLFMVKT